MGSSELQTGDSGGTTISYNRRIIWTMLLVASSGVGCHKRTSVHNSLLFYIYLLSSRVLFDHVYLRVKGSHCNRPEEISPRAI